MLESGLQRAVSLSYITFSCETEALKMNLDSRIYCCFFPATTVGSNFHQVFSADTFRMLKMSPTTNDAKLIQVKLKYFTGGQY